jgi:hypothetical protein
MWPRNNCTPCSRSTTALIAQGILLYPCSRTRISTGRIHTLPIFKLHPDLMLMPMMTYQPAAPRYRISMTTSPFLCLPTRVDLDRLGGMRSQSRFAFPVSRVNLGLSIRYRTSSERQQTLPLATAPPNDHKSLPQRLLHHPHHPPLH